MPDILDQIDGALEDWATTQSSADAMRWCPDGPGCDAGMIPLDTQFTVRVCACDSRPAARADLTGSLPAPPRGNGPGQLAHGWTGATTARHRTSGSSSSDPPLSIPARQPRRTARCTGQSS